MKTLRSIAGIAIALTATASVPGIAASDEPLWREVYRRQLSTPLNHAPVVVTAEGVSVTFTPSTQAVRGRTNLRDARIAVQFAGSAPYEVPEDKFREADFGLWVGIGKLAEDDEAPTVIITGFTGGAHCCLTFQAVTLDAGRPVTLALPNVDAEGPEWGFPEDVDGDGTRDIVWSDNSLLYAFTSYASSRPVPQVYNLRDGQLVDVSRSPQFAGIFREFAEKMLGECRTLRNWGNAGACATHAYAMAVLGRAEEGIRTAAHFASKETLLPIECRTEFVEGECPEGKEIAFPGFEQALRRKMEENGYLP